MATLSSTDNPFTQLFDLDGSPLDEGYVYIGAADQNPETAPIQVYWDQAGTQPAAQPIRTLNGYPVRSGTPAIIFPASAYSMTVRNKQRNIVFYAPDSTEYSVKFFQIVGATGSVSRSLFDKVAETVSVKDFGALGNGVADDTLSLQAAINYCVSVGAPLFVPSGTYRHTALTVSGALTMQGGNRFSTYLLYTNTTGDAFSVDSVGALKATGVTFACVGGKVSGSAFNITSSPPGTVNQLSIFRDCTFNSQFDCIHTVKAMTWTVENCIFSDYDGTAIHVQNDDNGDGGDSLITGCIFNGDPSSAVSVGVLQVSSGGLKIANNKFVSGAYGYLMRLAHLVQTADLLITGNSIENMKTAGIQMERAAGTVDMHFSNVTITGNQFLGTATGTPINLNDANNTWLLGVNITGNMVDISHAGASQYGIFVNAAQAFNITGNTVIGAAPSIGIATGATAISGTIAGNMLTGFTQGISNLSPTTSVIKRVLQGTSGTITCSTANGAIFTGAVAIAFPAGFFGQIPLVVATVNGGTNGIGTAVSGVGTLGATLTGVATTNGANITAGWRAEADY